MSASWQSILDQSIELRHWFHRHPELTWQEQNTALRIRQQLSAWDIPWRECAQLGTVATLAANATGPNLAFRTDMDALPINETAMIDYRSTVSGCMHACGHDGHMATLLGAAAWFKQHEDKLAGPVTLLFQPAEEGGHGAQKMIEDGALESVDCIYGWHNWPALPAGKALCPEGPVMSGNGTFHMTIQGRGGHASQPEVTRDPLLAAAAITLNLQQIVSRRLPPQAAAVVSVTTIEANDGVTVIPDKVKLEGSIRLSDPKWREPINALIQEITQATASSYGVTAEIEIRARYEATINHAEPAARFRQALQEEWGEQTGDFELLMPVMASEDFSYYLNEIPGAFALIGISEPDGQHTTYQAPCHSPEYVFNDQVVGSVIKVFSRLAGLPLPDE
jgi:hippurate hydrolase